MKGYLKTASILAIICAVAALILSSLNGVTAPIIADYEEQQTINALDAVSHGYEMGEKYSLESDITPYYIPLEEEGALKGYILELSGNGYGGLLRLVASYDTDGLLLESKVVSSSETPGLGKKSEKAWYMTKFIGQDKIPSSKNELSEDDSAAISGASITFFAISKALINGSSYIKTLEAK
jgi:electron transport complex protein RnfG